MSVGFDWKRLFFDVMLHYIVVVFLKKICIQYIDIDIDCDCTIFIPKKYVVRPNILGYAENT